MAPKPKKDSVPAVQLEDYTQDVLLVVSVPSCRLQLGLLASPELAAAETLQDASAAPDLCLELHHSSAAGAAPVVSGPLPLGPDFVLQCNVESMFRHKKGPDVIDRLINSSLELRLCNSASRAVLATMQVDLLPFGLGSSSIEDGARPWQPAAAEEVFKILPGSTAALSVTLKHQPRPMAPITAAPAPQASTSGGAAAAAAPAAAAAAAAALQAALEPFVPVTPEEAAGCNVLQLTAISAAPLPAAWATAAHAAAGGLSCCLQLHLPGPAGKPVLGPRCTGGCSSSSSSMHAQLEWPKQQQSCRVHLSASATAALKAHLELGQPLLLEVGRYLSGPAADTAADPAFGAYHALLHLGCAAEQLQELGAVSAAGMAVPVGAVSWAVQQGKLAAAGLPPATGPTSARPKPIEEAPAAAAAEGQSPTCAWAAAGTRFSLALRLAKPLWEPWQPPAQPSRHLADLFPPRPAPPAPAAPTAADRLRAKIQELARELAEQYAQQAASANSSSSSTSAVAEAGSSSSTAGPTQQQLVYELNRSGRYLAIKQQLRPLLVELVGDRYAGAAAGAAAAAGTHEAAAATAAAAAAGRPSEAQVQQLHHDLYGNLVQEMHCALAEVAVQAAAKQRQQQQQQQSPPAPLQQQGQQEQQDGDQAEQRRAAAEAQRLLLLAAECELNKELGRCQDLHLRRIAVLPTAEAWYAYGCCCLRTGSPAKAATALQEALALEQQHTGAAMALLCLSLAQVVAAGSSPAGQEGVGTGFPPADASVLERAEVLGHSLKERPGGAAAAAVVPWALLALLYRSQGKAKEAAARSCHQEVLRQCKAAWAAWTTANEAAAAAAAAASASSTAAAAAPDGDASAAAGPAGEAVAGAAQAAGPAACGAAGVAELMLGANGYLAAAEVVLQLNMPGLALKLLELAAGLKDPEGLLVRRLQLARVRAAGQAGDLQGALVQLREVAEGLGAEGTDEDKGVMQLLLGDASHQCGSLSLAKQHYRRALQKVPQHFSTATYLQLGQCFMASGDARVAADTYAACIATATVAATPNNPSMPAPAPEAAEQQHSGSGGAAAGGRSSWAGSAVGEGAGGVGWLVPGRCASVWLSLALAYDRLGDARCAELALSEANLADPEHPGVWGHMALLSLKQGREGEAGQALQQAHRCGLDSLALLVELGDSLTQLGRFDSAADCLARAAAAKDCVQVRCKLAAVLLSQRDYEGCRRQLSAAAGLPADEGDAVLLEEVVKKLQVNWPLL